MSPKLQSSLLRVLQDHSFTRIGSTQPRKADFRLICATNRSLLAEVKAGRFREDLYLPHRRGGGAHAAAARARGRHRAAGRRISSTITTPNSARTAGRSRRRPCRRWKAAAGRAMCASSSTASSAPWRCMQAARSTPCICFRPASTSRKRRSRLMQRRRPRCAIRMLAADFERDYLRRLLDAAGGNVSEAARLSGIPRQNFYVRMKRWGIVTE